MKTQCSETQLHFKALGGRDVVADFGGGQIASDGGVLLVARADERLHLLERIAACIRDYRDPRFTEHTPLELVRQRVYGIVQGYEDLNDHEDLGRDPLLATAVGKADPTGQARVRERDRGRPLSGKSTLNRLELTPESVAPGNAAWRYKKLELDFAAAERVFVEMFLEGRETAPEEVVLDFDPTDDPVHGHQEGRFFHGYYDEYCYLPLYIFCGEHLLCAKLRPSNIDASAGALEELQRIIAAIREHWPTTLILIRGDSGFCREAILALSREGMAWCERNGVHYLLGLGKNERLLREIEEELARAKTQFDATRKPARVFKDFRYSTLDSWSCERRVVGKAEHLEKGANPRLVVTSLPPEQAEAKSLYEDVYGARGDMENRIKEQQLCLFADRTSSTAMRANELCLWFSSVGYTLMTALQRLGLQGTELAPA